MHSAQRASPLSSTRCLDEIVLKKKGTKREFYTAPWSCDDRMLLDRPRQTSREVCLIWRSKNWNDEARYNTSFSNLRTAMKASCGTSTFPTAFILFFPSAWKINKKKQLVSYKTDRLKVSNMGKVHHRLKWLRITATRTALGWHKANIGWSRGNRRT